MDVDAHLVPATDNDQGIPERQQLRLQAVAIEFLPLNKAFCAIAEADLVIHLVKMKMAQLFDHVAAGSISSDFAGINEIGKPFEQMDKTLGPCIDYPGLAQSLELVRGVGEGFMRPRQPIPKKADKILLAQGLLLEKSGPILHDGEDSPLAGIGKSFAGSGCGHGDRLGKFLRRESGASSCPLRKTLEKLGQDGAGIAARPGQGPLGNAVAHLRQRGEGTFPGTINDALHGERHVGAGVGVRYRKDVHIVEGVLHLADASRRGNDCPLQSRTIDISDLDFHDPARQIGARFSALQLVK
ncbi:MAG: hypothetical protein BWY77_01392 [bacterium ADurb.Bin431]|nr:MAG: hypothetical protein BWY77_01392 [bacterium ADurb.Bin431]